MKIIVSALIVLSVLGLATAPASALDAKSFYRAAGAAGRRRLMKARSLLCCGALS